MNWYGSPKTLDVHVASLRRKIGHPEWIQAVRGVGFKLSVPDPATGRGVGRDHGLHHAHRRGAARPELHRSR